jgi:hypothetical protein
MGLADGLQTVRQPNVDDGGFDCNADGLVGRARFELATNGLKVRCSTG